MTKDFSKYFTSEKYKEHLEFWKSVLIAQKSDFVFSQALKSSIPRDLSTETDTIEVKDLKASQYVEVVPVHSISALMLVLSKIMDSHAIRIDLADATGNEITEGILPVVMNIERGIQIGDFLNQVSDFVEKGRRYKDFPIQEIVVGKSKPKSNVLLEVSPLSSGIQNTSHYDLIVQVNCEPDMSITLTGTGFSQDFLTIINKYLSQTLKCLENSEALVDEIPIFWIKSVEKEAKVLSQSRTINASSIVNLFEEKVENHPNRSAIVTKNNVMTYSKMNQLSNQLARYILEDTPIVAGQVVAVIAEKSEEAIIAFMAILKAGAVYLPIEPAYPVERIKYILEDVNPGLILMDSQFFSRISNFTHIPMFALDFQLLNLKQSRDNLSTKFDTEQTAYAIFTSGSTGKPKGTLVSHGSLINMVISQNETSGILPEDKVLQFASCGFDVSIFEICLALTTGAALVPMPLKFVQNYELYGDFIQKHELTTVVIPPSYVPLIQLDKLNSVKVIITGGEIASSIAIDKILRKGKMLINQYGLTETTCNALTYTAESSWPYQKIPCGSPITNMNVHLLDEELNKVPLGSLGEIAISGLGLAQGYLNDPVLTAQKFIEDPFEKGGRLFLTGDIGIMSIDGAVEFVERKDDQIKIGQRRIEMKEVESALLVVKNIISAVVVARTIEGTKELVAYFVSEDRINIAELRKDLRTLLPDYMVPTHLIHLDEIPLNINGKVDKSKLPEPGNYVDVEREDYVLPGNDLEKELATIWCQFLGIEKVDIRDNFFEIGGDSLKIVKIFEKLTEKYTEVVTISDLFDNPSIEQQAQVLSSRLSPLSASDETFETLEF